ncbi:hypothetical protein CTEN210_08081 [Chaetoceros tenuissimus]|uniref:Leucine-rich repeat domain-containing protein n=1 Tax=Chaetoceros tenuissimus TaxID=426638 RepID=A0AAD3H5Y1_9STRA|nr:hypothetical protein CTEN210_08081 [Chaetoceros tenuissimus]
MLVQAKEWGRFIPGVRMYKGKKTFFYNGEKLRDENGLLSLIIYDEKERDSWEVIIILPGVEIIPQMTFFECRNIEGVIMSDTVQSIELFAFGDCFSLEFVNFSRNVEYIGEGAFWYCKSLSSVFIPPSCVEIGDNVFAACEKLLILGMSQETQVGMGVFQCTALLEASPLEVFDEDGGHYDEEEDEEEVTQWIKSINNEEVYALHRACSSFNPQYEIVYSLVKRQGIKAMKMPNGIGITPSQYLSANIFADISEKEIIKRYISEMMREII